MSGAIDGTSYLGDPARDTGRGFVMDNGHSLDAALRVFLQLGTDGLRVRPMTPITRQKVHFEPQPLRHAAPECGELSGLEHEHAVSRRQRVDESCLPGSRSRGGKNQNLLLGLEDLFESVHDLARELGELRAAMVDGRARERPQHAIGHIGRPGNLQEMTTAFEGH